MLKNMNLLPWLQSIAVVGLLLGTWSSSSAQEGLFNVDDLDRQSDIIVVGTLVGGADGQLSLSVDRVIKGKPSLGPNLSVAWTPMNGGGCDTALPATPTHAIWFLKRTSDGSIELAPFLNSQSCHLSTSDYVISAGPINGSLSYQSSDTSKYKLAIELASALMNSSTVPLAVQRYPGIFGGINSAQSETIGQLLESSSSEPVRKIGQMRRISAASPSGLDLLTADALQVMQSRSNSAVDSSESSQTRDALLVTEAITEIHSTSLRTVSVLAEIASNQNQDIQVRRAASRVLRNIHTAPAVVAMAALIDDPDSLISMYALSALACYANSVPVLDDTVPGHNVDLNKDGPLKTPDMLAHFVIGPMESNGPAIKTYWKQWWQNHQASIIGSAGCCFAN
jgi:hypothetical protein